LLSVQHVKATQRAGGDAGWEWDSPWEVELSPYVDKEGWAYAPDWAAMDWPPQNGAQVSFCILSTCLCLAVIAAQLINIPACRSLYERTANRLHILSTAGTCLNVSFCSVPLFVCLKMCLRVFSSMQHMASRWQQPVLLWLQKRGVVDFTRRRRWLRRRRQDLTRPSPPPQEASAPSPRQSPAARRTTSIR